MSMFSTAIPEIDTGSKRTAHTEYDGHIDIFDDRKTMLEWATGKRKYSSGKYQRKKNY